MELIKMHGIGNDYIYFNCLKQEIPEPEKLAVRLSDRHKGVGGDGIVLILPSGRADFRMRMFNADGSEGKMCGNAARCVGKYVYDLGLTDRTELTLETLSGVKNLRLHLSSGIVSAVTVDMGRAVWEAGKIPVALGQPEVVDEPCTINGQPYRITCVSMGNPHCVIFGGNPAQIPLEQIGPCFENLSLFPERINTEFVEVKSPRRLVMRVWERGSGETMACGTGACAAVAAAVKCGHAKADEDVTVQLPGGELTIRYQSDGRVLMTGPAQFVFRGELFED